MASPDPSAASRTDSLVTGAECDATIQRPLPNNPLPIELEHDR